MIIRGGVNISPFEIDELLMNMPGVKAGLAVGFENDWYGEEVGAYVQCKDGTPLSEEDVLRHLRNHLSFDKCPKVVIFGNDIPVTSTGKYQRNKLKPLFENQNIPHQGKVVIGTVYGDLHDIGKNLVGIMLKGAGFSVVDLGKNVSAEQFIEAAVKEQAKVIGMSALLTTTMIEMKRVVDLLNERGLNGKIRTIVGGASTSERFAREINADAYGFDAVKAVERVRELIAN